MEEGSGQAGRGLLASSRRLLRALLGVAVNRLELLAVEAQEERWEFFAAVLLTAAVIALGGMALIVATVTVIVVFWESHRVAALTGLSVLYLAAAWGFYCRLRRRLKNWSSFSSTLNELKKDKEWLENKL